MSWSSSCPWNYNCHVIYAGQLLVLCCLDNIFISPVYSVEFICEILLSSILPINIKLTVSSSGASSELLLTEWMIAVLQYWLIIHTVLLEFELQNQAELMFLLGFITINQHNNESFVSWLWIMKALILCLGLLSKHRTSSFWSSWLFLGSWHDVVNIHSFDVL